MRVVRYSEHGGGSGIRLAAHEFNAVYDDDVTDDTRGRATFSHRSTIGAPWSRPAEVMQDEISYADWKKYVEADGFTYEERWLAGRLVRWTTTTPAEEPASS